MSRTTFIVGGVLLLSMAAGGYWLAASRTMQVTEEDMPAAPAVVHTVIGKTAEGRAIDAYTYGTGRTEVLFVGGIHGGYEWNAVALAFQYKAYLDENPQSVPDGLRVTVIPDLNVDGTYRIAGKEGPIAASDIPEGIDTAPGRLNAHGVDLNRNFACRWQPEATWRSQPVGAGTEAFSEPESRTLRDFIVKTKPAAVVFWHSQSGNVYAAECGNGPAAGDIDLMHTYARAAGYGAIESFDAYPVTGDAEGWLASIGIPAITVELTTHADVEWQKNLAGIRALLMHYAPR